MCFITEYAVRIREYGRVIVSRLDMNCAMVFQTILLFLVIFIPACFGLSTLKLYEEVQSFRNKLPMIESLWVLNAFSRISCSSMCTRDTTCRSFNYVKTEELCRGYDADREFIDTVGSSDLQGSIHMTQYELCPHDEVACKSGGCIPKTWRCDSLDDCLDSSDEENCKPAESCLPEWYPIRYSCYYFSFDVLDFYQAMNDCEERGGYIAMIQSDEESDALLEQVQNLPMTDMIFIGGSDEKEEGVYRWYPSEKLMTYTNWYFNEPNNLNGIQHCVAIAWSWTGTMFWDDVQCDVERFFICERPPLD